MTFDVYGASGGNVVAVHNGVLAVVSSGGAGGEARARFAVHAGEKFVIAVGGQGGSVTEGAHITGAAGVNGGGFGDDDTGCIGCGSLVSGGGGGASDVRIGGRGNACLLNPQPYLANPMIGSLSLVAVAVDPTPTQAVRAGLPGAV